MKNFLLKILLFSLLICPELHAQNKVPYKELFIDGTYALLDENYNFALKSFLMAYEIDSSNANINFNVGYSYLYSQYEKNLAIPYLQKAVQNTSDRYIPFEPKEKKAPSNAYYYLGLAYRLNYNFHEATLCFEKFKRVSKLYPRKIFACDY